MGEQRIDMMLECDDVPLWDRAKDEQVRILVRSALLRALGCAWTTPEMRDEIALQVVASVTEWNDELREAAIDVEAIHESLRDIHAEGESAPTLASALQEARAIHESHPSKSA